MRARQATAVLQIRRSAQEARPFRGDRSLVQHGQAVCPALGVSLRTSIDVVGRVGSKILRDSAPPATKLRVHVSQISHPHPIHVTAGLLEALQATLAGHYTLEREIGRGGMGVVFLARETRLDRAVAIKVLPRHLAVNPDLRERFLREARTAAQLSHPHIVPIFRADEIDGFAFFTMGFIDGENLAERLQQRGPLSMPDAVRLLRETAWALAYAHARGVVHRDVKPENIMVERGSSRAIVTDFGIARDQLAASLTADGMVLGSAHYMSPEQAAGDAVDGRSDLYSLGVVGFQILSGQRPFEAKEAATVMAHHVTRPAPSLASVMPQLPHSLVSVIDRCLSKSPSDRYPNGEALAEALQLALESVPSVDSGNGGAESVSTDQARAIWLRAAQLQAEASTRLQERYRLEAPAADVNSETPGDALTSGFRLRDVERAAAEAGIGAEFVAMAIAERPEDAAHAIVESSQSEDRRLTQAFGTTQRSISCTRVIRATPKTVLETMGRVFIVPPFSLKLRDTVGGHPLDGGIMVFNVPMMSMTHSMNTQPNGLSMFSYRMTQIAVDRLNVVLKPVSTGGCEVTVYGDLREGLRKNWRIDKWISASAAAGGALGGGAFGLAALSAGALAALTATGGAALLGGLALVGYRSLYRYALRKASDELAQLLSAIDENLRAQSVFGTSFTSSNENRQLGDGSRK